MRKKILTFITLTGCFIFLASFKISPARFLQRPGIRTIVIDAGHGGKDGGAQGNYSWEKDITLQIALKLQKTLQDAMPDVNIVMTRTTDVFDAPPIKANKANSANGDLFISIHCDAADPQRHSEQTGTKTQTYYTGKGKSRKKHTRKVPTYRYWTTPNPAKGASTYIWAAHKNDDKELAMRENESLYIDSSQANEIKDFDPDSPEKMILYRLKTQQYFERSASLALTVEEEFSSIGRSVRDALQRQVGIWVLQATAMPSILVETGYITNPEEEDYLNSDKGQQETADVITKAVIRYRYSLEHPNSTGNSN
ncbi:MAG TPA: N-acetylmuramoyl-L-alanine amidase [Panacibacter sp.]|nr:N-acetylmuramoyl-L-alanine amidase [Panacibacter sp.]HNP45873.1 N-acetylmuramoyl-L-alanine amidase [Panacibacter sp.]